MASTQAVDMSARPSTAAVEPMVSMRGITKAFPNVMANDEVDLDIHRGELHANQSAAQCDAQPMVPLRVVVLRTGQNAG